MLPVPVAFLAVILIWSTTPLAIQWSSEGWGYLFGVTGRMVLGALVCVALVIVLRRGIPLDRKARETYMAAGLGIYGAMMCVYWSSQYIPSGLIAVLFGLSPITVAILAAVFLREDSLTSGKILGALLGVTGLVVIFDADLNGKAIPWQGVVAMLGSVTLHSLSAVWVKRINSNHSALTVTTGGLLVVAPLYVATWFFADGHVPTEFSVRPGIALIYLGVFGSVIGFSLYFYILSRLDASRVALIPLITPVTALLLGQHLNHEVVSVEVWVGAALIIFALSMHQWGDQWFQAVKGILVPVKR
ncbi:MAG: DMT family transporter [Gammaproteobacteria bacterium]|jgi:drug/metabolite transporter (DMT)-like permease